MVPSSMVLVHRSLPALQGIWPSSQRGVSRPVPFAFQGSMGFKTMLLSRYAIPSQMQLRVIVIAGVSRPSHPCS